MYKYIFAVESSLLEQTLPPFCYAMSQKSSSRHEGKKHRSEVPQKSKDAIVTVFPDGKAGGKALEALVQATGSVYKMERVPFEQLDFGNLNALDKFYSASVVVVDVTEMQYGACLYYQIGLRLSFGMKHNVVLCAEQDTAVRNNLLTPEQINTSSTGVRINIREICL